jgi:uncharacterized SAM-binding protein YcdF (DUF218 family)
MKRLATLLLFLLVVALTTLYLTRDKALPFAATWLDVGQSPEPCDYILALPGDPHVRPFVAAALVNANIAQKALIVETAHGPDVADQIRIPGHELTRKIYLQRGVAAHRITTLHGSSVSTFSDIETLATIFDKEPDARVAIVTSFYHTRRTKWVCRRVLPESALQIQVISAPVEWFQANNWWHSGVGVVAVLLENIKFALYVARYGDRSLHLAIAAAAVLFLLLITWKLVHRSKNSQHRDGAH